MNKYYLHRNNENHGPYDEDKLRQLISTGDIGADELICIEGGADWLAASSLTPKSPQPVLMMGGQSQIVTQHQVAIPTVSQVDVSRAYQALKLPFLGIVFSIGIPFMLWAAQDDAKRGVGSSRKNSAVRELATNNAGLLPVAKIIAPFGVILCGVWLGKRFGVARAVKAEWRSQNNSV